jgi:chromosome partitioning protein
MKNRTIAMVTNKGGCLKSSSVLALSGVLLKEHQGKKPLNILIIDGDTQGNICTGFNLNADDLQYTLADVLIDDLPPEAAIINAYKDKKGKIDILPSNDDLSFLDFEIYSNMNKYKRPFYRLKDTCSHLKEQYDFILLDSPPSLSLIVANIISFSDEVIIPFQPEAFSRRSFLKALNYIHKFKKEYNPDLKIIGIFGTLVDSRTVLHSKVLQDTRRFCVENNIHMLDTVIPRSIKFANAVAFDKLPATLLVESKKDPIIKSYYELWEEIRDE